MWRKALLTFFSTALAVFIVSCSGGGGGGENGDTGEGGGEGSVDITGVWSGTFSPISSTETQYTPKGTACIEFNQSDSSVSGKSWISGVLWGEDFSGNFDGNNLTVTISGKNLSNENVEINIDGSLSDNNTITGTVTFNGKDYEFTISKTDKQNCGWADRDLAVAFGYVLGSAISGDNNNPDQFGYILASFITEIPKADVKVDNNVYQDWWVCIWEVKDNTTSEKYTLGGIIETTQYKKTAGWYTDDIGLDDSRNSKEITVSLQNLQTSSINFAGYIDNTTTPPFIFGSDGSNDTYYNQGTTINGEPFFVSECNTGKQYVVWMSEIPFYLKFDGANIANSAENHSFESPPNPSNTNLNAVPSLYIEINSCP